jgi:hypothetical protein
MSEERTEDRVTRQCSGMLKGLKTLSTPVNDFWDYFISKTKQN